MSLRTFYFLQCPASTLVSTYANCHRHAGNVSLLAKLHQLTRVKVRFAVVSDSAWITLTFICLSACLYDTFSIWGIEIIVCTVQHRPMEGASRLVTGVQRRSLARSWKSFAFPLFRAYAIGIPCARICPILGSELWSNTELYEATC